MLYMSPRTLLVLEFVGLWFLCVLYFNEQYQNSKVDIIHAATYIQAANNAYAT